MTLNFKDVAYKSLAKSYLEAQEELDKITDMIKLILDDAEKQEKFDWELDKLKLERSK